MNRGALFVILVGAIAIALLASGPIDSSYSQSPVPTATWTPSVPTDTPPPTDTPTPLPPTATNTPPPPTATNTPLPPTATNTPLPPTDTPTPLPPPPDAGEITIDSPEALLAVDEPFSFTLVFTDPGVLAIDTVVWDWGDGTSSSCASDPVECTVDWPVIVNSTAAGSQSVNVTVTGSHAYSDPGVYTVQVTVLDIFGQFDTATYEFVIVYDPGAGFVTGGGWIDSAPGAYQPDPTLTGKATFGFVSKYKKGSSRPTGNTMFQFKVAGLTFYSDTYHWLVVNQDGTNAQFKGEGTLNGAGAPDGGLYRFMIWATDGRDADAMDTFRIRIWWEDVFSAFEVDIYDNGSSQAVSGGSITVQQPSKHK
ncbi:MAG: hypothetical protein PVJ85_10980 [Anaerolineae bacterium]